MGIKLTCSCLVTKSCLTLCDPMNCSTPGFPVLHYLPEFAQSHVHWVGDAIQPCHPLLPPSALALNLSQHQGLFSSEQAVRFRWPKYQSFRLSPSDEYSRLIFFRIDWFDLLAVQETLKESSPASHFKSINSWCSAFFTVQLSHPYMTTRKTMALTVWTFVGNVMSLIFNTLSSLPNKIGLIVAILGLQKGRLRFRKIKQPQCHVADKQMGQDSNPDLSSLERPCTLHHLMPRKVPWQMPRCLASQKISCKCTHIAKMQINTI